LWMESFEFLVSGFERSKTQNSILQTQNPKFGPGGMTPLQVIPPGAIGDP